MLALKTCVERTKKKMASPNVLVYKRQRDEILTCPDCLGEYTDFDGCPVCLAEESEEELVHVPERCRLPGCAECSEEERKAAEYRAAFGPAVRPAPVALPVWWDEPTEAEKAAKKRRYIYVSDAPVKEEEKAEVIDVDAEEYDPSETVPSVDVFTTTDDEEEAEEESGEEEEAEEEEENDDDTE